MSSERTSVKLDVVLAPSLLSETGLEGAICAVIDVLRATTTIVTALSSGAVRVLPFASAAEARAHAAKLPEGTYLLGGEERGRRIPDFHLGNSPYEYLAQDTLSDKTILFSTTNGTPTMGASYAKSKLPIYIAALVNVSAVSAAMVRETINGSSAKIALVCAGRHGRPGAEDIFCAGLMAEKIGQGLLQDGIEIELTDSTMIAIVFATRNRRRAREVLGESEHGGYLESIGFAGDLGFASQVDRYEVVPIFSGEDIALR